MDRMLDHLVEAAADEQFLHSLVVDGKDWGLVLLLHLQYLVELVVLRYVMRDGVVHVVAEFAVFLYLLLKILGLALPVFEEFVQFVVLLGELRPLFIGHNDIVSPAHATGAVSIPGELDVRRVVPLFINRRLGVRIRLVLEVRLWQPSRIQLLLWRCRR